MMSPQYHSSSCSVRCSRPNSSRPNSNRWYGSLSGWFLLCLPATVLAQKAPEVGYVFPPVVQRGAETDVVFGGFDWTQDSQVLLNGTEIAIERTGELGPFIVPSPPYWFGPKGRLTAMPIPREMPHRLTIGESLAEGPQYWQMGNANGISSTSVFYVSRLRQVVEQRDRDRLIDIGTLPVGVSGRLEVIAEEDRYRLTADRTGWVTVRLLARQLGADFHGAITIRDESNTVIAEAADPQGDDLLLSFPVEQGKAYDVTLFDVDFRGNRAYVYHLEFRYGQSAAVTVPILDDAAQTDVSHWRAVPGGGDVPVSDVGNDDLQSDAWTPRAPLWPVTSAAESNPNKASLKKWSGDVLSLQESHRYIRSLRLEHDRTVFGTISAGKGEQIFLHALSRRLGAGTDVHVRIEDPTGKVVVQADDGERTSDASLVFTAPADGEYIVVVDELSDQAGKAAAWCAVMLARVEPELTLSTAQTVSIPVGGKATVTVNLTWRGGFAEPIQLNCRHLPAGVTLENPVDVKPNAKNAKLTLVAAESEPAQLFDFQVVATWGSEGTQQERLAMAPLAGDLVCWAPELAVTSRLRGATTLKAPVKIQLVDKNRQRAVHRGTTYPAPFIVQRDEGYAGDVLLQMAARQSRHRQGIDAPIVRVPPGQTEVLFPCFLPEWLETDRTTRMVVMGVAMVEDQNGQVRRILAPADARVTMILEGALLKVSHQCRQESLKMGETLEIPFEVARAAKLPQPVEVHLDVPAALRDHVECEPVILPPGVSTGRLIVRSQAMSERLGRWTWQIRAEALQADQWLVRSLADLEIDLR